MARAASTAVQQDVDEPRALAGPPPRAVPRRAPRRVPAPVGPQPPRTPRARSERPGRRQFRADVEGLRAVAVVLVVLYHAGVPGVPGGYVGVDVFFVLSGFLITGLLVRELRRTGRLSLPDFYARRARRLLPVSALVLLTTAVAADVLLPAVDRGSVAPDVRAAALYVANWHFALSDTDYLAATGRSPVLHLWSLGVEEQFYALWPLLLVGVVGGGLARRSWSVASRRVALTLAVLGTGSLVLSARLSRGAGPWAYYGLHTRAWELAAGAALALALTRWRPRSGPAAAAAGWCGLALVVGSALVLDGDTAFPGTAAAWPVLGTVLVVLAGSGPGAVSARGVGAALSGVLPRYLGRISYAWYLWHWPCLVLLGGVVAAGTAGTGPDDGPTALRVLSAVAVSLVLAVLTHHLVEQPVRRNRWLGADRSRTLALAGVLTAVTVLAPSLLSSSLLSPAAAPLAGAAEGAAADGATSLLVAAQHARVDRPAGTEGCYLDYSEEELQTCRYGPADGERTVVLLGDSHAEQWFPPLQRAAEERHWTLYFFAKAACPIPVVAIWSESLKGAYPGCSRWRADVLARVEQLGHVDEVVVARSGSYEDALSDDEGGRLPVADAGEVWERGSREALTRLSRVAGRVVLLASAPRPPQDVPRCVSRQAGADGCAFAWDPAARDASPADLAERRVADEIGDGVGRLDLADEVCPTSPCAVTTADGGLKFRDDQHLTRSFALELAPALGAGLDAQLPD